MEWTLEQLASKVDGEIYGDASVRIDNVATIKNATSGQITFLCIKALRKYLPETKATAVILKKDDLSSCSTNAIIVANPLLAYAKIASLLATTSPELPPTVHSTAVIDTDASIHASASIGAYTVIGKGAVISKDCHIASHCYIGENVNLDATVQLHNNVSVLKNCSIGERTIIHPGAVIGADGFGNANDQGKWVKIPQLGAVVVGADVEIGANTTIDCGAIENTIIGNGVRLDNLIQIAHNVEIGDHTAIAAMTAVAGSTIIGQYCMIGGTVAISGHLKIADRVTLTGRTTVLQSIKEAGVYSSCAPLVENSKWHKNYMQMKKMDDLVKRVKQLEKLASPSKE